MEDVADRTIVHNHDLAKIRLHLAEILDISAISRRAVLAIISLGEVLPLDF